MAKIEENGYLLEDKDKKSFSTVFFLNVTYPCALDCIAFGEMGFVEDVLNSLLKHITLENNDNKLVTNSRDTQEVKLEQGLQVLKIFKDHSSRTCILDDFGF
ncbi:hypothetical protein Vadar_030927 [Vaccinium darrowii]|uniref:Uncharacterized protein n=1 Tax=Vaccinium darrowii TaxID=229202 RepID=A0ACB7ZFC0_9ERIC|nr:hypothetical protein Vadar_030927 [Vaccinium darrowii]